MISNITFYTLITFTGHSPKSWTIFYPPCACLWTLGGNKMCTCIWLQWSEFQNLLCNIITTRFTLWLHSRVLSKIQDSSIFNPRPFACLWTLVGNQSCLQKLTRTRGEHANFGMHDGCPRSCNEMLMHFQASPPLRCVRAPASFPTRAHATPRRSRGPDRLSSRSTSAYPSAKRPD